MTTLIGMYNNQWIIFRTYNNDGSFLLENDKVQYYYPYNVRSTNISMICTTHYSSDLVVAKQHVSPEEWLSELQIFKWHRRPF